VLKNYAAFAKATTLATEATALAAPFIASIAACLALSTTLATKLPSSSFDDSCLEQG